MSVWSVVKSWWRRERQPFRGVEHGDPDGAKPGMRHSKFGLNLELSQKLLDRYVDYENMDDYPDCSSALDVFADDATVMDQITGRTVMVDSDDSVVKERLDDLFVRRLRIDEVIWEIARQLGKYGSEYELLLVDDKGVQGLEFMSPAMTRRVEKDGKVAFIHSDDRGFLMADTDGGLAEYVDQTEDGELSTNVGGIYAGWRVAHFRLMGKSRVSMYGHSLLEAARWPWKRLVMLEDAMMIFRLTRSPSRFAFYVDVGKLPRKQAEEHLDKIRRSLKKKKVVDPSTGAINYKYNAIAQDEDFFLPVRDGRESVRVDTIQSPMWQYTDDVEYLQNKLHSALTVPRAYLGYDEALRSRATLSQEDVRFARAVLRFQRALKAGLRHIAEVDLALAGIDPAYVEFQIKMPVASSIFELAQLEVVQSRVGVARDLGDWMSRRWILANIFGLSDQEIMQVETERVTDKKNEARAEIAVDQVRAEAGGDDGGGGRRGRWESVLVGDGFRSMDPNRRRSEIVEARELLGRLLDGEDSGSVADDILDDIGGDVGSMLIGRV